MYRVVKFSASHCRSISVPEVRYRREDAIEKKSTINTYWVPGVNPLGSHGRWAFAEFTEVFQIESDFKATVDANFNKLIEGLNT